MRKSVELRVKSDVMEKLESIADDLMWTYNVRVRDENGDYRLMTKQEVDSDDTGYSAEAMEKYKYAVSILEKVIDKIQ